MMVEQATIPVDSSVPVIVDKLRAGTVVNKHEVQYLLGLTDESETQYLFDAARSQRARFFGNTVFLYGFLYFSTHCKNDCCFCQYRKTNRSLKRYRKSTTDICNAAIEMETSGVHLIDLTMGEDQLMLSAGSSNVKRFGDIVLAVKDVTDLPLMISPGVLDDDTLAAFGGMGIDFYACYQETMSREHFSLLRSGQSFDRRLASKRRAKTHGMLTEEGLLLGAGETLESIAESLFVMRDERNDQVRAMTFVSQKGVTIDYSGRSGAIQELLTIAVMRLLMPDRLIPASLDVDGLKGLTARLDAGANVVTSIVPPDSGLAGVANNSLDIKEARRSMEKIIPVLKSCGLEVASKQAFKDWLSNRHCTSEAVECV